MFEEVKTLNLPQSGPYTKRTKTDLIVLHHFGNGATVESVARYHIGEGHAGIDYNIIVLKAGEIVWGRGLEYAGGHTMNKRGLPTYGVNARSVSIAFQGNFMAEHMSPEQFEAGKSIISEVVQFYNIQSIKQIVTHREIAGVDYTDCPGMYFPADDFREFIRNGGKAHVPVVPAAPKFTLAGVVKLGSTGPIVKKIQAVLNAKGANPALKVDGDFGPKTEAAVRAFQAEYGLKADGIVGKHTTVALGGTWVGK